MTPKYSLYLLGNTARLNQVNHPILATEDKLTSLASRFVNDPYIKRTYWLTPVSAIPDGVHSFGGWRFAVRDGSVTKVKEET